MIELPGPETSDEEFHTALARLPETTAARLLLLAVDRREDRVRAALRRHLHSTDPTVRAYAAAGSRLEDAAFLAYDKEAPARRALASRADLTETVSLILAMDSDEDVLNRLATNPTLPAAAQIVLAAGAEETATALFFYGNPPLAAFLVGFGRAPGSGRNWALSNTKPAAAFSHHEILEALRCVPQHLRAQAEAGVDRFLTA